MNRRQLTKRQSWCAEVERLCEASEPGMKGRMDWDTALHLFNTGLGPVEAATVLILRKARREVS